MGKTIVSLQALKAVAFICIFAQHSGLIMTGGFGVNLFLALSGFLMYYNYHNKPLSCSFSDGVKFSINKISKLYRLNVITLIFIYCYYFYIINNANHDYIIGLTIKFIIDLTMLEVWIPDTRWSYPLTGAAWYLGVYLFVSTTFPLLIDKIKKVNKPLAFAVIFTILNATLLMILHFQLGARVYSWASYVCPLFRLSEFLAGCFLAKFYFEHKSENNTILYNILSFMSVGVLVYLYSSLGQVHFFVISIADLILKPGIALLMIYLFVIKKDIITNLLSNKLLFLLGDITPIAFLIHEPLITVLSPSIKAMSSPQNYQIYLVIIAFIGTIMLSAIYRRCTESRL